MVGSFLYQLKLTYCALRVLAGFRGGKDGRLFQLTKQLFHGVSVGSSHSTATCFVSVRDNLRKRRTGTIYEITRSTAYMDLKLREY